MNLSSIRSFITRRLDMNPNLNSWKDGLDADIDIAYQEICDLHDWLFLRKEGTLTLLADVDGSSTQTLEVASPNVREVLFTGVTPSASWAGQTLIINSVEYTVGAVSGSSVFITSDAPVTAAGEEDWTLRQDRAALPYDCSQAIRFISRADSQGLMSFISREEASYYGHDRQEGGDTYTLIDMFQDQVRPPEFVLSGTSVNSGGSLTAGQEWDICYTYSWRGLESPPSPVATVTVASGHNQINLADIEDTRHDISGILYDSGKQKRVYARRRGGRWHFVKTLAASATTTSFLGTEIDNHDEVELENQLFEEGPRLFIEPWVRVGTDKEIAIEYLRRPRPMKGDSDVPSIPVSFHNIVPMRVLMERFLDHGDDAAGQRWKSRYEERLGEMQSRYLSRSATRLVKKSMVTNMARSTWSRVGTVRKF